MQRFKPDPSVPGRPAKLARPGTPAKPGNFAKPGSPAGPGHLSNPGNIAPARSAAFAILHRIATTAAHADDLLHAPAVNALSPEDRNLTTALVLGVLRWQLALDARVRPLLQRPDAELHPAALLALRLGVFQLEYLERIPAHAAINESVELARANGAAHAAGMVNALLRRMLRNNGSNPPARQTLAAASPAETAHPQWLLQRWRAHYGGKATRLMATYDQAEPPQHGLFQAPSPSPESGTLTRHSVNAIPSELLPHIDDGSRLVAEIASLAAPHAKRILDCCAAPGGKTLILAHRHRDAEIVAVDINERRLTAMQKRLDTNPAASRVKTVLADMATRHIPSPANPAYGDTETTPEPTLQGSFDLVLCDAPCSGTGTLARNPEIRHRLRETDLPRQAERQLALLRNAVRRVAPGGRLVYSTCSMEPEENEAVIRALLAEGSVCIVPLAPFLEDLAALQNEARTALVTSALTANGALRTIPGLHTCDGFYTAVLERL